VTEASLVGDERWAAALLSLAHPSIAAASHARRISAASPLRSPLGDAGCPAASATLRLDAGLLFFPRYVEVVVDCRRFCSSTAICTERRSWGRFACTCWWPWALLKVLFVLLLMLVGLLALPARGTGTRLRRWTILEQGSCRGQGRAPTHLDPVEQGSCAIRCLAALGDDVGC